MSNDCCNPTPCVPGRLVDPLAMTPFPVAAFPAPGDDNRFAVLLGDDGNLYVSDGVDWNEVGGSTPPVADTPDFSGLPVGSKYQSFRISVRNEGGVIKHAITTSFNSLNVLPFADAGGLASKVNNASSTLTATPTGTTASLTPVAGAMIPTDGFQPGSMILDVNASDIGDLNGIWSLNGSNVGGAGGIFNLVPAQFIEAINGVTKPRLYLTATDENGGIVPLTNFIPGHAVVYDFAGYMV
jgi:hypothetical protein